MKTEDKDKKTILIAQVGKTVGLNGHLKLNLFTDFVEQFTKGNILNSSNGELEILTFDKRRNLIKFKGFEDLEGAKKLTNVKIFSSVKETREKISLKSGEYFWFDIIDCKVIEGEKVVGTVSDIHRVFDVDYLNIKTDKSLVKEGMAKSFLIPYLDRYILSVDVEAKKIFVKDSINILEAS